MLTSCLPVSFPEKKCVWGMGGGRWGSWVSSQPCQWIRRPADHRGTLPGYRIWFAVMFFPRRKTRFLLTFLLKQKTFLGSQKYERFWVLQFIMAVPECSKNISEKLKKKVHHLTMLRCLWTFALVAKLLLASLVFLLPCKIFTGWL